MEIEITTCAGRERAARDPISVTHVSMCLTVTALLETITHLKQRQIHRDQYYSHNQA
jgi:hypothetical protein